MKILVIISLLLLSSISTIFTQNETQRLLQELSSADKDSTVLALCNQIGKVYYKSGKIDSAKHYLHRQMHLARRIKNLNSEVLACQNIGTMCLYVPEADSAKQYFNKVFELTQGKTEKHFLDSRCRAYINAGINYGMNLNQTNLELEYYLKGLQIAQTNNFETMIPDVLIRISTLYLDQRNHKAAMQNAEEALKVAEKSGNKTDMMNARRIIGIVIGETSTSKTERLQGLDYMKTSLNYYIETEDAFSQTDLYLDIGDLYADELGKDSAIWFSWKAYQLTKEMQTGATQLTAALSYAKSLVKTNQPEQAIPLLQEANELIKTYPSPQHEAGIYEWFSMAYEGMGDYKNALINQRIYQSKADSANQQNFDEKLLSLQTQFETNKKEKENEILRQQNELITTRSNLYGISGLLLAVLLLSGLWFFFKIKKTNRQLESMNASKNQLFAILAHDLKGPAASFQNLTRNVGYLIKKNQPERLLELSTHFENSGRQVSFILGNLLDWAVSQKDQFANKPVQINLKAKVEAAVEEMKYLSEPKNIAVHIDIDERHHSVFDENAIAIVARNLLHNAIKFARPNGEITIRSFEKNKLISLEIKDDGVGMSKETVENILRGNQLESSPGTQDERGNALGLQTCLKLIRLNRSRLLIESEEGKGSTFRLVFA